MAGMDSPAGLALSGAGLMLEAAAAVMWHPGDMDRWQAVRAADEGCGALLPLPLQLLAMRLTRRPSLAAATAWYRPLRQRKGGVMQ